MGEEIGMLDPDFDSMEKYADVESLNAYQELLLAGTSEKEAFKIVKAKSRTIQERRCSGIVENIVAFQRLIRGCH